MSLIVSKPFDTTKKIDRIVYRGAPAIMNTEDSNRQEAANRYFMDNLAKFLPLLSDMTISVNGLNGNGGMVNYNALIDGGLVQLSVAVTGTYVVYAGAKLAISSQVFTANEYMDSTSNFYYLNLFATKTLVTAEADSTKTISGVKFADNSTALAASHYVWSAEQLALTTNIPTTYGGKDLVACLAKIYVRPGGIITPGQYANQWKAHIVVERFFVSEAAARASFRQLIQQSPLGLLSTDDYPHNYRTTQPTDSIQEFARIFNRYVVSNTLTTSLSTSVPPGYFTGGAASLTLLLTKKQGLMFIRAIVNITESTLTAVEAELTSLISEEFKPQFPAVGRAYGYSTNCGKDDMFVEGIIYATGSVSSPNWHFRVEDLTTDRLLPVGVASFSFVVPCNETLRY